MGQGVWKTASDPLSGGCDGHQDESPLGMADSGLGGRLFSTGFSVFGLFSLPFALSANCKP